MAEHGSTLEKTVEKLDARLPAFSSKSGAEVALFARLRDQGDGHLRSERYHLNGQGCHS